MGDKPELMGPISAVYTAIARAAANYTPSEWSSLAPEHRTEAVYRELRELDAATVTGAAASLP